MRKRKERKMIARRYLFVISFCLSTDLLSVDANQDEISFWYSLNFQGIGKQKLTAN